jgi:hypothetical protein
MQGVPEEVARRIAAQARTGDAGLGHVGEPGAAWVGDQAVERVVELEQFDIELRFGGGECGEFAIEGGVKAIA